MTIREPINILDAPYERICHMAFMGARKIIDNGGNKDIARLGVVAFVTAALSRHGLFESALAEQLHEIVEEVGIRIAHHYPPPPPQPVYVTFASTTSTGSTYNG